MASHVAFIRGINVGGHAKVSMEALRTTLAARGLKSVRTLLQTGNVVFNAPNVGIDDLAAIIRETLLDGFLIDADVMIRSRERLIQVIANNPFSDRELVYSKFHVLFLKDAPSDEAVKELPRSRDPAVEYSLIGRELYLYCGNGMGRAILPDPKRLFGTTATARNWNTLLKVSASLED